MGYFDAILTAYKTKLDQAKLSFSKELDSFIVTLDNKLEMAVAHPETASDIFDIVSSSFSVGVGDSTTGIYGKFVSSLTSSSQSASGSISDLLKSRMDLSQSPGLQGEIDAFTKAMSDYTNSVSESVSSYLNSVTQLFFSRAESSRSKAADMFILHSGDTYVGAVQSAHDHSILLLDSLRTQLTGKLNSPDASNLLVDRSSIDQINPILDQILTEYNDALTNANDEYNLTLGSYRYFPSDVASRLAVGNSSVGSRIDQLNSDLNTKFSDFTKSISDQLSGHQSIAFSIQSTSVIQYLMTKLSNIEQTISSSASQLLSEFRKTTSDSLHGIQGYLSITSFPHLLYGTEYSNFSSDVRSHARDIVSTPLSTASNKFQTLFDPLQTQASDQFSAVSQEAIDFINTNSSSSIPQDQVSLAISKINSLVSDYQIRLSNLFENTVSQVNQISAGAISTSDKLVDSFLLSRPILKIVGTYSLGTLRPCSYEQWKSTDGCPKSDFSISLTNVGHVSWVGAVVLNFTDPSTGIIYPHSGLSLVTVPPGEVVPVSMSFSAYDVFKEAFSPGTSYGVSIQFKSYQTKGGVRWSPTM